MLSRTPTRPSRLFFVVILAAAVVGMAGRASAGPILYLQGAQSPVSSVRPSQNFGSPLFLLNQTWDEFDLSVTANISQVGWQGAYFNSFVANGSFNPPANATGFGVAFYSDASGTPGSLLSQYTFSPAAAGQTFVGQQAFPTNANLGLGIYQYNATLPTSFLATAGTAYWLSVFAFSPVPSSTEAQWGWTGGTGGNGTSYFVFNGAPVGTVTGDRAFTLTGDPVPEPSTLLLLGGGLATAVARRRARRRSR